VDRRCWGVLVAVAVAGCQAAPVRQVASPPARVPAPVRVPDAASAPGPARIAGRWSFSVARAACVARAGALHGPVAVTIRVDEAVHVTMAGSRGSGPAAIVFAGPGGTWRLRARSSGGLASATRPLDDAGVAELLAAIDGGAFSVAAGQWRSDTLTAPEAGVSGRDWIGCVRDRQQAAARALSG